MRSDEWSLKILGETPNEIWIRVGQVLVCIAALSAVGFNGFGMDLVGVPLAVSIVIAVVGLFCIEVGTRRERVRRIMDRRHQKELMDQAPNKADRDCLEGVKQRGLPVTTGQISADPFPGDLERDHHDLAASSTVRRLVMWSKAGELKKIGDTFYSNEDPEGR